MLADISGSQWNEGDVSCSALRRIALPDAFYATDAILEIMIQLLDQVSFDEERIREEIEGLLPEISSSSILMLSVKKGIGREFAHRRIKEHAIASRGKEGLDFFDLVLGDDSLGIGAKEIEDLKKNLTLLSGDAAIQAREISQIIKNRLQERPELKGFLPTILR